MRCNKFWKNKHEDDFNIFCKSLFVCVKCFILFYYGKTNDKLVSSSLRFTNFLRETF